MCDELFHTITCLKSGKDICHTPFIKPVPHYLRVYWRMTIAINSRSLHGHRRLLKLIFYSIRKWQRNELLIFYSIRKWQRNELPRNIDNYWRLPPRVNSFSKNAFLQTYVYYINRNKYWPVKNTINQIAIKTESNLFLEKQIITEYYTQHIGLRWWTANIPEQCGNYSENRRAM